MSTTAPWLALAADWMDSEMFEESTHGERLAWICLLCHVKSVGRAGRAKMNQKAFERRYELSERAVKGMIDRAQKCAAIGIDNGVVTLCNWKAYQDPRARSRGPNDEGFSKTTTKDATQHPVPRHPDTQHPAPPPKSPAALSGEIPHVSLIPTALRNDPHFIESWCNWCDYQSDRGPPVTSHTAGRQLTWCSRVGAHRAIAAIEFSIESNYTKLVEPSDGMGRSNGRTTKRGGGGAPDFELPPDDVGLMRDQKRLQTRQDETR